MSNDWFQDMLNFQRGVNRCPKPFVPQLISKEDELLRRRLVQEEVDELFAAMNTKDLVKIADGIGDSIVVLLGTAIEYGIDMRPIWNEIHKTNMAKLGGPVREDGKQLKPEGWKPPDIERILLDQLEMELTYEL